VEEVVVRPWRSRRRAEKLRLVEWLALFGYLLYPASREGRMGKACTATSVKLAGGSMVWLYGGCCWAHRQIIDE
jgi:hypothetical protein